MQEPVVCLYMAILQRTIQNLVCVILDTGYMLRILFACYKYKKISVNIAIELNGFHNLLITLSLV